MVVSVEEQYASRTLLGAWREAGSLAMPRLPRHTNRTSYQSTLSRQLKLVLITALFHKGHGSSSRPFHLGLMKWAG